MSDFYKVLAQGNPGNVLTDLYRVPIDTETIISSIVVTNRDSSAHTFRLAVAQSGASDSPEQYIDYDTSIGANVPIPRTLGITLQAGDVIRVYADSAEVSFNIFGVERGSSSMGSSGIIAARIVLTDAQIKALPTTPVDLVSAPGAGKRVSFLSADIIANCSAGAYTNITDQGYISIDSAPQDSQGAGYIGDDSGASPVAITALTALLGAVSKNQCQLEPFAQSIPTGLWGNVPLPEPISGTSYNAALQIYAGNGGGNFTGGNAANTLIINLLYRILTD